MRWWLLVLGTGLAGTAGAGEVSEEALAGPPVAEEPPEAPLAVTAAAPEPVDTPWDDEDLMQVTVFGDRPRAVENVPGSATVVTAEDLEQMRPLTGNEVFQTVPGVTVTDEEGMGLRMNIGLRGLDPNRSRKVLVLEDGVPIALAPYGEPEMYYNPPIERMERVEVVKGSGSILHGPQTIGGVVNYITPKPPEDLAAQIQLRGGTWGYFQGYGAVGDTVGPVGLHLSALHQRFRGPRHLDLQRTDVTGKAVFRFTAGHTLAVKAGLYDEASASTYLGLTTPQFETDPNSNFAIHDDFTIRRYAGSLVHGLTLGRHASLRTHAYAHWVKRDWWRQDFDRSDLGDDYERVIDGKGDDVTDSGARPDDGSAIYFRDSTALRGRTFFVTGVEPRLAVDGWTGPVRHALQVGARLHYEQAFEVREEAEGATSRSGDVVTQDHRYGTALAAYALDRLELFDGMLQLSPGVRLESLWTRRDILRADNVALEPPRSEHADYLAVLPGLGVAYKPVPDATLFAGVHRGWAPPRTKDAVTTDGQVLELEAEHSWNYEVGGRVFRGDWLYAEAAFFWLDFSNQVVPPSEAGGAVAEGTVNGGSTSHLGVEAAVHVDPLGAAGQAVSVPLGISYTWSRARFGEGWSAAITGQPLPYSPEHQLCATVGLRHPIGLDAQVKGTWVAAQYADKVATVTPSTDGLVGLIPARMVLDAQVGWTHEPTGISLYVAGKNLLDQVYIASRAPRGIQPGMRRHVFGGIGWKL